MHELIQSGTPGQLSGMARLLDLFGCDSLPGPITKWDRSHPGLGVRVNRSGSAVWIGKFRTDGKQTLITLGSVDTISYDEAKTMLDSARAGNFSAALSFRRFADLYLADYDTKKKATWDEERRRINRYLLPAFGDLPLAAIKSSHTRALHAQLSEKTPRQADQVLALLRVMLNRAIKWGMLPEDHPVPFRSISWNGKRPRDRYVTAKEMPRLMSVIATLPRLQQRAILLMYLLTGCRKMELVNLRWDEIDEDGRRIRLSASRNKSGTIVYKELSALAMAILLSLPRDQLYVFPGRYRNTRMKEVSSLWRKVRAEAGLNDVVLHDLRRTTGSWLAQGGESLHLIAQVLGQTTDHVTKTYAHFENQHKKDAVERLSDKLSSFIDPSLYQ